MKIGAQNMHNILRLYNHKVYIFLYLFMEIRHYILKQCQGIYIRVKNYIFGNDILKNCYDQKNLGVLRGDILGFGWLRWEYSAIVH